jgi:hypothetical protein
MQHLADQLNNDTKRTVEKKDSPALLLQSVIDENKEDMKDEVYLKLCTELMKVQNEYNAYVFYELMIIHTRVYKSECDTIETELIPVKRIIRVEKKLMKKYMRDVRPETEPDHIKTYHYLCMCATKMYDDPVVFKQHGRTRSENHSLYVNPSAYLVTYDEIDNYNE